MAMCNSWCSNWKAAVLTITLGKSLRPYLTPTRSLSELVTKECSKNILEPYTKLLITARRRSCPDILKMPRIFRTYLVRMVAWIVEFSYTLWCTRTVVTDIRIVLSSSGNRIKRVRKRRRKTSCLCSGSRRCWNPPERSRRSTMSRFWLLNSTTSSNKSRIHNKSVERIPWRKAIIPTRSTRGFWNSCVSALLINFFNKLLSELKITLPLGRC